MTTTCWGVAHAAGGISRTFNRSGRIADAHMIRKIELDLPEPGLTVTLDHDNTSPVGEVIYAELTPDDRLNIVSILDDDWILDVDQPIFYSAEFDCRGRRADLDGSVWIADRAYLTGLSVVMHPASMSARPLDFMRGDIRQSFDRSGRPISWRWSAPLLERALEHLPPRGETRARRIVGPPPKIEPMAADAWLVNGELVARTGRPPGGLECGPPGRIISVR